MKPTKCPAKEKKLSMKREKRGEERKRKVKAKTAVSLLNLKTTQNFAFFLISYYNILNSNLYLLILWQPWMDKFAVQNAWSLK